MTSLNLTRFQKQLKHHHLAGAVVSKRENIQYLTLLHQMHPTNREAILFVTPNHALLYHSLFLSPPVLKGLESQVMDKNNPLTLILSKLFPTSSSAKPQLAIEAHDLKVAELDKFRALLPSYEFIPLIPALQLEQVRQIKSSQEIEAIHKACRITGQTMAWISKEIKRLHDQEITETQLSRLIENHMYDLGATGLAFPTVVAFDAHSASPHHQVTHTKLTQNSVVLLDFGCQVNGYASDMTRTICLGTPPPRFKKVELTIKKSYQAAVQLLSSTFKIQELTESRKPPSTPLSKSKELNNSLKASDVDTAARSVIESAGFGDKFIHTTGHSLGLEIHEQPSISSINLQELKPGMVITIEPGIYLGAEFGYRHENTVLLEKAGI